ncbi:MAG: glycosyltransferase family 9 protein [Candidatus Aenigmarchaeota archaeon]|nr:glycosyltransferase family 9 protein [Candidatus Aenigmarchaeota archaeon]
MLDLARVRTVVVIKGSSIGDIITGIPMLRNLRAAFPSAVIILACSYKGKGISIVKNCPYIDEHVTLDYKTDGMLVTVRKVLSIRKRKPDIVINGFPTTAKSSVLAWLIGGALKLGIASRKKTVLPFVFDRIVKSGGKTAVEAEDSILRTLGMPHGGTHLELFLGTKGAKRALAKKLAKCGIGAKDRIVGFYFGKSVDICRSWRNEKWAELMETMREKHRVKLVFIGGNDSALRGNAIERLYKRKVCNFIGKLRLEETAALLQRCSVFVTTNAGPMQLAAALGTPMVALHGSSLPEWYPHARKVVNLRNNEICAYPCGNDSYCTKCHGRSIKDIPVADVYKAAKKVVGW